MARCSGRFHVCGVAGVGMSAIAQALAFSGFSVSGSDRFYDADPEMPVFSRLRAMGIEIMPQDGSGITGDTESVVFSTAIEDDNPDILQARALKIPIKHRSVMLAELVSGKTCVAIAGTCGKTTTTAMAGVILEGAGLDPFVVNGGAVLNWRSGKALGNVRPGSCDLWVIEVDESDRSLLNFRPDFALITNMSSDHFDKLETEALFKKFADQVKNGVAGCFGTPSRADILKDFAPDLAPGKIEFSYRGTGFCVPQTGMHNAENALMAVVLCEKLGVKVETASRALSGFKGVERRLELAGSVAGVDVFDDYAHNPAKITAAWKALSSHYKRVIGVWRPHGYGPLRSMFDELVAAFSGVMRETDRIYLLPVFDAGGTAARTIQSDSLANALLGKKLVAGYAVDYAGLTDELKNVAGPGDVVLIMGARDPELPVYARKLLEELCCL